MWMLIFTMGWMMLDMWRKGKQQPPQQQTQTTQQTQASTRPSWTVTGTQETAKGVLLGSTAYDPKKTGNYSLAADINPRGASIKSVTLNAYRQHVKDETPYVYQEAYDKGVEDNRKHSLATQGLSLDGDWVNLFDVEWSYIAAESNETKAVFRVELTRDNEKIEVSKRFEIKPSTDPSKGHEVLVSHQIKNLTSIKLADARVFISGPMMSTPENSRDTLEMAWGYGDPNSLSVNHKAAGSYKIEAAETLDNKDGKLAWVGMVSTYFESIVRPTTDVKFENISIRPIAPPTETGKLYLGTSIQSQKLSVDPGQEAQWPVAVYFGPKHRDIITNNTYYTNFGYDKTLVLTSGPCGWCTFQKLVDGLVWLLNGFHYVLRDWGLAIIALVCIVRVILHPLTRKSQEMMSETAKLQPEMDRLKKKYADDKEELQRQTMALYSEKGFKPLFGCLPMFIQMPIWIALWSALQSTFELRHAPFLWNWTWMKDLAQPDHLIAFKPFSLWFFTVDGLNLLPFLLGAVFWFQNKLTPKPPAMDDQQRQQQAMMQWMTLLFPVLLYNSPCGLNLYICASTTIGIIESKIVRNRIKAKEEAEKAGRVIVDAKVVRSATRKMRVEEKEKPKTGIRGWFERLQKMAEEAQREAQRRKKDK